MEQLVIVLIIGAISLIKWLMEKSAEARAKAADEAGGDSAPTMRPKPLASPWDAPRPIARPLSDANTEAARRLRKALGLPEESELPPPIEPRPESAPSPVIVHERPLPLTQIVADLEQRVVTAPPPRSSKPVLASKVPSKTEPAQNGLDGLLRSRDGLRRAILVQEILGTPKGLVF